MYDLLKKHDNNGVKQYIEDILSTRYTPEELLSKGVSLYEPWMRSCMAHVNMEYTMVGNDVGIRYQDGWEYSNEYTKIEGYRFPIGFDINTEGILYKNNLIYSQPIFPCSILIIDNGRYESYYKFYNCVTKCVFISPMRDIKVSSIKRKDFNNFVNLFIKYNLETPSLIKREEFI